MSFVDNRTEMEKLFVSSFFQVKIIIITHLIQGISSEWSGDTTELVYIQRRRDLIG